MPAGSSDDDGNLTPIGQLIEAAREGAGLSQRKAAAFAGLTGRGWGYLVKGLKSQGELGMVRVGGRAETLARMAHVVGLTPEQVDPVRPDVAERMRIRPFDQNQPSSGYDLDTVLNLLDTIRRNTDPAVLREALQRIGWVPPGWPKASGSRARI